MFSKRFIAATKEYTTYENHVPAPLFRKNIEVKEELKKAVITVCGLGFYEFYVNGKYENRSFLAPYISNPDDRLYYDEYDITSDLKTGRNTLGFMLGNGMLNCPGGAIWNFDMAEYRSAPKLAIYLTLDYGENKVEVIEADESFHTMPSAVLFDDLRCGEIYDARNYIDGWNLPEFEDCYWDFAIKAETPRGEPVIGEQEPITVSEVLHPISVKPGKFTYHHGHDNRLPDMPLRDSDMTGYIYDFGVNAAGNIKLKIKGKPGQRIAIQFSEALASDGGIDTFAMSFQPLDLDHRVVYYCKGDGIEEYTPHFTYQGFRYCLISGLTEEQATPDLAEYLVMGSEFEKNGDFSCSDDIINRIQSATNVTNRANFFYFPTDCPHREKNGWTCDAALSTEQMMFNMNPERSLREWIRNIRDAQREDGAIPGVIPTSGWGFEWGAGPGWDRILVYIPYYIWLYRGDKSVIRENAHTILRYLDYASKKRDERGLVEYGLEDWMPIDRGYGGAETPVVASDTLMTMNTCRLAAILFRAIGQEAQARFAEELFNEFRTAARTHLLEEDGVTVIGRNQTGQCMGINYGLFTEEEKIKAFKSLMEITASHKNKLYLGTLGLREIFHTLSDFGESELAFDMIRGPEYPSYGYMTETLGCTALCEAFWEKQDYTPLSVNHHFFGDVSSWFMQEIAGVHVNPDGDNCNAVLIRPRFISKLDHAEGYIGLVCGRVSSAWVRKNDEVVLTVTIPEGCTAKLEADAGYRIKDSGVAEMILAPGKHQIAFTM